MSKTGFLESLTPKQRELLIRRLWDHQAAKCYISGEPIDLQVHEVDLDHIIARSRSGKDDESNIGLALAHHNRSKGVRDLELQRRIFRFYKDLEARQNAGGRNELFTVGDLLQKICGSGREVSVVRSDGESAVQISWTSSDGAPKSIKLALVVDQSAASLVRLSCFGRFPAEIVHHSNLNPRSIHDLEPMIEEFYYQHPQMQPSLAYFEPKSLGQTGKIMLFDGQHKAAAQLYNLSGEVLCRLFLPEQVDQPKKLDDFVEELRRTNFRAHTKLAQLHFAQFTEDKVGHALYADDREDVLREMKLKGVAAEDLTEKNIYKTLKEKNPEEAKEFKDHHASYLRYEALTATDLEIMKFVETVSARSRRYPISYDTLKSLLDVFLFRGLAEESVAQTDTWRLREKENMGRLLDILATEALAGRFKLELGVYKLDEKLEQNPQGIPVDHLRAYRLFRKPALKVWAETLRDGMCQYLVIKNKYVKDWYKDRPLWADVSVEEWEAIRRGVQAIVGHKIWAETQKDLLGVLSSTRQKDWASMMLEGKLPGRPDKLYAELNVAAVVNAMAKL
jgi:hypothetical protein